MAVCRGYEMIECGLMYVYGVFISEDRNRERESCWTVYLFTPQFLTSSLKQKQAFGLFPGKRRKSVHITDVL